MCKGHIWFAHPLHSCATVAAATPGSAAPVAVALRGTENKKCVRWLYYAHGYTVIPFFYRAPNPQYIPNCSVWSCQFPTCKYLLATSNNSEQQHKQSTKVDWISVQHRRRSNQNAEIACKSAPVGQSIVSRRVYSPVPAMMSCPYCDYACRAHVVCVESHRYSKCRVQFLDRVGPESA